MIRDDAPAPLVRQHGRHILRAGLRRGRPVAGAYLAGAPRGAGPVAEMAGPTPEAALQALAAFLDRRHAAWLAAARLDAPTGACVLPPAAYAEVLAAVPMSPLQAALLTAQARAGAAGLTPDELAATAGRCEAGFAARHLAALGRSVAHWLGLPGAGARGAPLNRAMAALASIAPERRAGAPVWRLHPEVAAALEG